MLLIICWQLVALSVIEIRFINSSLQAARGTEERLNPQSKGSNRWALIVGINEYKNLSKLKGAENDAKQLRSALINNANFPEDQIFHLSTNLDDNKKPTRAVFFSTLYEAMKQVPPDGLFLFAFSGHGVEVKNSTNTSETYLIPLDAEHNSNNIELLKKTSISLEEIKQEIIKQRIQQVVMLIDSCREDPTTTKTGRAVVEDNKPSEKYVNSFSFENSNTDIKAFISIHASKAGQRAWEYEKEKMGFFTWAIVQALTGTKEGIEASNINGDVTIGQLLEYLEKKLPEKVKRETYKEQNIHVNINKDGISVKNLILARVKSTIVDNTLENVSNINDDDDLWNKVKISNKVDNYSLYTKRYPSGSHIDEARQKMKELELEYWEDTKILNHLKGYIGYLEIFPPGEGIFAKEAQKKIEEINLYQLENKEWENAQTENTKSGYIKYRQIYPSGKFINDANNKIAKFDEAELLEREENDWKYAKSANTIISYQNYRKIYPNGKYQDESAENINRLLKLEADEREQLVWIDVKNKHNLTDYSLFIAKYPNSKFLSEAQNEINKLKDEEVELVRRRIEDTLWNESKTVGSQDSYLRYLNAYPTGHYIEIAKANLELLRTIENEKRLRAIEDADWEIAKSQGSEISYKKYLVKYPQGRYKNESLSNIAELERQANEQLQQANENLAWQNAQNENSSSSYQRYINNYPNGRYTIFAKRNIALINLAEDRKREDLAWNSISKSSKVEDYLLYLDKYPQGNYVEKANNAIVAIHRSLEELAKKKYVDDDNNAWNRAQIAGTIDSYRSYLSEYPQGSYVSNAHQQIQYLIKQDDIKRIAALDDALWQSALNEKSIAAYQGYLSAYPTGRSAEEALKKLNELREIEDKNKIAKMDEDAWNRAYEVANRVGYLAYLNKYPNGRFATNARDAIKNLERLEIMQRDEDEWKIVENDRTIDAYLRYIANYPVGIYVSIANQRVADIRKSQELIQEEDNLWKQVITEDTAKIYERYVNKYPNGRYVVDARKKIDELNSLTLIKQEEDTWKEARNVGGIESYQMYLKQYPKGQFVELAVKAINELARIEYLVAEDQKWKDTLELATISAYRDYLSIYPKGRYLEEANRLMTNIIEENAWNEAVQISSVRSYNNYLTRFSTGRYRNEATQRISELGRSSKLIENLSTPATYGSYSYLTKLLKDTGEVAESVKKNANEILQKIDETISLSMVKIKGGSFFMGTSKGEVLQIQSEYAKFNLDPKLVIKLVNRQVPSKNLRVETFYIGKYEVTQQQWRLVSMLPKVKRNLNPNPSFFKGDDLPVDQVTWEDAYEFCERLSQATGQKYRLPSEAEWEYAARAGNDGPFGYGETITPLVANYHGSYTYGKGQAGIYRKSTISVGSLIANSFGLYDMHGNVSEWVSDEWRENYLIPSKADLNVKMRVIRGGSWNDRSSYCRSAHRTPYESYLFSNTIGFRVALSNLN